MQRFSDAQWKEFGSTFPKKAFPQIARGRKPIPSRKVLDCVLWMARRNAEVA
jgi:hypothetical protein